MEQLITGIVARWEVIWWSRKGKKFVVVEFENDLSEAIELYTKARVKGLPFSTLRCCNVGFPPPEKYRPHTKRMARRERTSRGRTKKIIVEVEVTPMSEMNLKGVWWCPYCCKMRKFKMQDGAEYEDYIITDKAMYCPVCQINHTNHHVRRWNPQANRLPYKLGQRTRRRNVSTKRRRARKR